MNEKEVLEHKFQTLRQVVRTVVGADPLENSRRRPVADAKRIFCQIIYEHRDLHTLPKMFGDLLGTPAKKSYITTPAIGRFLNRDHTSILHLLKTTPILLKSNKEFKDLYNSVYTKFGKDIYKRLQFTEASIEIKEKELEYLYNLRDELINLKNVDYEKGNVPKQGVLFEIPIDDKSIENV